MSSKFKRVATTSERLKEAMSLRKMKQVDIMRSTGLDRGSVSHYVSGNYEPKNEAIFKMAKALDVNEMWLWGYDVPMERTAEQKKIQEDAEFHARILKDQELLDALKVYYKLPEIQQRVVIDLIYSFKK
jgi:transcriptional regulator with XRE-family HTH domain|nr:MAG TPA: bifunctional HTH-domain containing protein/aminotransferase [Caudoviricetes sp.]